MLVDDDLVRPFGASDVEQDRLALWTFIRKFWLPILFFINVLQHWGDPITHIAVRVILFLLASKPRPYSVYVSVDEVRSMWFSCDSICNYFVLREPNQGLSK